MIHKTTIHGGIREEIIMYTLLNENFINMVRSFYPTVKVASGGEEIIVRCFSCGDSDDIKHAHLYISVPHSEQDISMYHCKKCGFKGIVDDAFLRRLGCEDANILIDVARHINDLKELPSYRTLQFIDIYPIKNGYVSNNIHNQDKINYINNRIGSNFSLKELIDLKVSLNIKDLIQQNNFQLTRDPRIVDALNEYFVGFISYDNSYCTLRKVYDNIDLYGSINKRYVNYSLINKYDNSKDYYVIPTMVNIEDPSPVNIHIAEGVFDILSIYYNLNKCNKYQNIYITSSGKSYLQALNFILSETGIVNYRVHLYPDNDVTDREFDIRVLSRARMLPCDIYVHRNVFNNTDRGVFIKDYGVPMDSIKDSIRIIKESTLAYG